MTRHGPIVTLLVLFSVLARAQEANHATNTHALNGEVCSACHVTRRASAEPSPTGCTDKSAWDCALHSRIFLTYDAPLPATKQGSATSSADDTQVRMSTLLCASCHDGVSTHTMNGGALAAGPRASNAVGLSKEHPVDVPHDPAKQPGLAELSSVQKQLKLYGHTNNVQCSTCHDVHDGVDAQLLRKPNHNSSLCVICHL